MSNLMVNTVIESWWPVDLLQMEKNTLQTIWLSVTNTWNDSKNHNWPCVCVTCLWLRYHANLNWLVFRRPWIASGCATFYCVRTTKKYHKCILLSVFNIQIEHCEQSQSEHNYDYSTYGKILSRKKNAFNFAVHFLFNQMFMFVFFAAYFFVCWTSTVNTSLTCFAYTVTIIYDSDGSRTFHSKRKGLNTGK